MRQVHHHGHVKIQIHKNRMGQYFQDHLLTIHKPGHHFSLLTGHYDMNCRVSRVGELIAVNEQALTDQKSSIFDLQSEAC